MSSTSSLSTSGRQYNLFENTFDPFGFYDTNCRKLKNGELVLSDLTQEFTNLPTCPQNTFKAKKNPIQNHTILLMNHVSRLPDDQLIQFYLNSNLKNKFESVDNLDFREEIYKKLAPRIEKVMAAKVEAMKGQRVTEKNANHNLDIVSVIHKNLELVECKVVKSNQYFFNLLSND